MKRVHLTIVPIMLIMSGIFYSCDTGAGTSSLEKAEEILAAEEATIEVMSGNIRSMSAEDLAAESSLPIIIINTENGAPITSKEEYVHASFEMTNAGADNIAPVAMTDDGIRLRGNFTYFAPKKPYRIKFNKKTSLFGRTANKSWVLLADYYDLSHIRNYAAFTLAARLGVGGATGMTFAPLSVHVNLILNGKFQGLYLLSDQVDEKEGRTDVEVDELPAEEVPFLAEIDFYAPSEGTAGTDYFIIGDKNFAIKYPEAEDRDSPDQFTDIETYIRNVDAAIRGHAGYEDLIDIDAFIDFYLVQELMGQWEINFNSVFMSRAVDGKLRMGPVWDFDGTAGGHIFHFKDGDYTWNDAVWFSSDNWFAALLDDPDFVDNLYARWTGLSGAIDEHIDEIEAYRDTIRADVLRDQKLWKLYLHTANPLLTFDGQYQFVLDYLVARKEWMTATIADLYDDYY